MALNGGSEPTAERESMMHAKPGFVIAILHNNKPLRESFQNGSQTVCLPFGDEYTLRLKNKTGFRAYASVTIDGTEVSPGRRFLLHAGQTLDLERFILDGDLEKGKRFKFISLEEGTRTGEIQDPTNALNGLISVSFYPEQIWTLTTPLPHWLNQPIQPAVGSFLGYNSTLERCGPGGVAQDFYAAINGSSGGVCSPLVMGASGATSCVNDLATAFAVNSSSPVAPTSSAGATVEGSDSSQRFTDSHESFVVGGPITMTIQLKGRVQPTVDVYKVNVKCNNCDVKTFGATIPKGQSVAVAPCPNCGVSSLRAA